MATRQQIDSNRRNAQRSTGPRTRTGKAAAKLNSLKHGLLAEQPVLPDEDGAAFDALRRELTEQFDPVGIIETQLVERVAGLIWRLRRLGRIETGIIEFQRRTIELDRRRQEAERLDPVYDYRLELHRSPRAPPPTEASRQGAENADTYANTLHEPLPKIGHSFIRDAESVDALGKLQRYERSMERSLYTAIRELERLQRDRREKEIVTIEGEVVPSGEQSNTNVEQLKPLAG